MDVEVADEKGGWTGEADGGEEVRQLGQEERGSGVRGAVDEDDVFLITVLLHNTVL